MNTSATDGRRAAFVAELCRVGKAVFITTPDRRFPIEHHTGLPLLHYLPARLFRSVIGRTSYRHWAKESNLNILTGREFERLFPGSTNVTVRSVTLAGLPANLVAFAKVPH